jgi:hypothetical protein
LIVSLSVVACFAIVVPPRTTTPEGNAASARHTIASRNGCGSLIKRPSSCVMALSATPSSIPAKIKNSVAAKCQANDNSAANNTVAMPPTTIAHARSLRADRRSSLDGIALSPKVRSVDVLFRQKAFGIKRGW